MRELIAKDEKVFMVPHDFKKANKGTIKEVTPDYFTLELDYVPDGVLLKNYCEFYVHTRNGILYFDSFAKKINDKILTIASPAKHKFLQRRQYTRIKYILDTEMICNNTSYQITILDISAGGMKIKTKENINIVDEYQITLSLSEEQNVVCKFSPIRIEKNNEDSYTISGKFDYFSNTDKMMLTQYCAKRSIEIKNK